MNCIVLSAQMTDIVLVQVVFNLDSFPKLTCRHYSFNSCFYKTLFHVFQILDVPIGKYRNTYILPEEGGSEGVQRGGGRDQQHNK